MSTVDEIRQRLIDSQLAEPDAAEASLCEWREQAEDRESADDFVNWGVQCELLTEFQGEALLDGYAGPFMLGPYEVKEHLASGKFGGVFRAIHQEFEQPVSLKVFLGPVAEDPEKLARTGREIRILIELDHPNVVRSYQAGRIGGIHYLAMENLQGATLEDRLEPESCFPFKNACGVVRHIASGLSHLHSNGVVHRDVRPGTVWLGENGIAKLFEFSGARDALSFVDVIEDSDLTTSETVIGDYNYMAPEQAMDVRKADALSDIYALGCLFYRCLTGRTPFVEKNPIKLTLKQATEKPEPPSSLVEGIPSQIDEVIAGMLAKDPGERYQKADDVVFALEPYVAPETEPDAVSVAPVSDKYLRWIRRTQPKDTDTIPSDVAAITRELANFLGWMARKKTRRRTR